jgi:hypothetical protein
MQGLMKLAKSMQALNAVIFNEYKNYINIILHISK